MDEKWSPMDEQTKTELQGEWQRIKDEYERNFVLLLKSVGSPEQDTYVKIENELYRKELAIMHKLGICSGNPCPLNDDRHCCECSGYYVIRNGTAVMVEKNRGRLCGLKFVR